MFSSVQGKVFNQAKSSIEEYKQAQSIQNLCPAREQTNRGLVRWIAPRGGVVKINWDAAFDPKNKKIEAGVIVRDNEGKVLVALSMPKLQVSSLAFAEANALWGALKLGAELGISPAFFEGDVLGIIKAINNSAENWEWKWNGQKVEDIKVLLANRPFWKVQHNYR
ncbi:uncharacterized protein LOC122296872 [Carya illinoinensis]|uniref:uncharacterized protein LOC122296872 n=1 Tax=Carya illinoinensis TaxID=32201 RepID=UPI001C71EBAB|nr:uncharacterized protein LOC122296872 [Carya illinoinensis]